MYSATVSHYLYCGAVGLYRQLRGKYHGDYNYVTWASCAQSFHIRVATTLAMTNGRNRERRKIKEP